MRLQKILNLTLMTAVSVSTMAPAFCSEVKQVSMTVTVKAKPSLVWTAIQGLRQADKEHRKLVSYKGGEAILEEKFSDLPVIGDAVCTYKECEVPLKRIDYSMISSDHFKTFEGSWVLTPSEDGENTVLNLSSSLDPGLRVPFWKELTKVATQRSVKKRLSDIREISEKQAQRQLQTASLVVH